MGNTFDSNCAINTTNGYLDEDDRFPHVDDVANETHANGAASHKHDHYSGQYDRVEGAYRMEARNPDEDNVEDQLNSDSRNKDKCEATGEQFY
jgi:hypothetical protein